MNDILLASLKKQQLSDLEQCAVINLKIFGFSYCPRESTKIDALEIFGVDNNQYSDCASTCQIRH